MNKVILMGRLTRNPETRYTEKDNMCIARFALAVDRRVRQQGQQAADFPSCVAFGKTAEFIEKYTRQGTKLVIEGRIQTGSYTNRDGNRVYVTEVIAESVEFAESKAAQERNRQQEPQPQPYPETDENGFMQIPDGYDDTLPFT